MRRLCKNEEDCSEIKGEINLMTRFEVEEFMDATNDVNKWSAHVREYLKDVNDDLLASKKHMFIIDSEIFLTNTQPVRRISVMVDLCFFHSFYNRFKYYILLISLMRTECIPVGCVLPRPIAITGCCLQPSLWGLTPLEQ